MKPLTELLLQLALSAYIIDWVLLQLVSLGNFIVTKLENKKCNH